MTPNDRIVVVDAHRAQPIGGSNPPIVTLRIEERTPSFDYTVPLAASAAIHREDAEAIEAAFFGSLPGATYDALLRAMLLRRASHFVVPFADPEPAPAPVEPLVTVPTAAPVPEGCDNVAAYAPLVVPFSGGA